MQNCPGSPECKAIFGARVIPTLAIGSHNPSATDIESVIAEFGQLLREIAEFGPPDPLPNFAVVRTEGLDIATIDRWFEREPVAEVGEYVIYRLDRRSQ